MEEPAFGAVLRAAIARSGLSLDDLSRQLGQRRTPVSASALSYWQSGANQPERARSLAALAGVEEILGLDAGALTSHLRGRRRRGRVGVGRPHDTFWDRPDGQARALAKLGATPADTRTPHKLSQHVTYRVGADRCVETLRVRRMLRGDRDVAARMLFTTRFTTLPAPPVVVHAEGCAPSRFRVDVPTGTCVFEFALDRPLGLGELASVEFTLRCPPGQADEEVLLHAARPSRDLTLGVRFHPDRPPRRCHGFRQEEVAGPRTCTRLDPAAAQVVVLEPEPGGYGIAWTW